MPIEITSNKIRWNYVNFSSIKIISKKLRRNDVNFSPIKITWKKVCWIDVDLLSIEIWWEKVRRNDVDFSPIKITLKKYVEMKLKFANIFLSMYRCNIDIQSTSMLRAVSIEFLLKHQLHVIKKSTKFLLHCLCIYISPKRDKLMLLCIVVSFLSCNFQIKSRFSSTKHTIGGIWDTLLWRSCLFLTWQSIKKRPVADRN